jgi:hypothetical protein
MMIKVCARGAVLAFVCASLTACGLWPVPVSDSFSLQRFVIGAPGAFRLPEDTAPVLVEDLPFSDDEEGFLDAPSEPTPMGPPSPNVESGGAPVVSRVAGGGGGGSGGGGVTLQPAATGVALPGVQLGVSVSPGGFVDPEASVAFEVFP